MTTPLTPLQWQAWNVTPLLDSSLTSWVRTPCPDCFRVTEQPTLLIHPQLGYLYCEHCGYHGDAHEDPKRFRKSVAFDKAWWNNHNTPLNERAIHWFKQQGISSEVLLNEEIFVSETYFDDTKKIQHAFSFPSRDEQGIHDVLYLRFNPTTKFIINSEVYDTRWSPGGSRLPWGMHNASPDFVILVDNPMDRLALLEAGYASVLCIPEIDTKSPKAEVWSFLKTVYEYLNNVGKIVFAFPYNERGQDLETELSRRLGMDRCFRVAWHSFQDTPIANRHVAQVLHDFSPNRVSELIETAIPFPIAGVYELNDVEDRFDLLYEFGLPRGQLTGYPSLDEHYTVFPGQWTLITGIPGHGKSNFLDTILVNMATLHDWRIGIFSPENQPIERHFASLMEKKAGVPFNDSPIGRITVDQKELLKPWLNDHFKVILPSEEDGNWSLEGVLQLAKGVVYRHGIRGLVIDPWNEIDHSRTGNMSETEYISSALSKIRRFARVHNVHIWVVAHPTKLEPKADGEYPVPTPYNVSGGAHWRNKADVSITVYRYVGKIDDDVSDIHIQKVRFKEIGKVGVVSLRCGKHNNCFYDDIDQVKRAQSVMGALHLPSSEISTPLRHYANTEMDLQPLSFSKPF